MANGTSLGNSRGVIGGSELYAMDEHKGNENIELMDKCLGDVQLVRRYM